MYLRQMSSYILIGPCVCENASIGFWTTERVLTPVSSLSSAAGSYDTTRSCLSYTVTALGAQWKLILTLRAVKVLTE